MKLLSLFKAEGYLCAIKIWGDNNDFLIQILVFNPWLGGKRWIIYIPQGHL